jgi:hypothetical protein
MLDHLSEEIREQFNRVMANDEYVIWAQQPERGILSRTRNKMYYTLGWLWIPFCIGVVAIALIISFMTKGNFNWVLILFIVLTGIVFTALSKITRVAFDRWRTLPTYVLTNKSAFVVQGALDIIQQNHLFRFENIKIIERPEDTADFIFSEEWYNQSSLWINAAFIGVRNADEVKYLLADICAKREISPEPTDPVYIEAFGKLPAYFHEAMQKYMKDGERIAWAERSATAPLEVRALSSQRVIFLIAMPVGATEPVEIYYAEWKEIKLDLKIKLKPDNRGDIIFGKGWLQDSEDEFSDSGLDVITFFDVMNPDEVARLIEKLVADSQA